MPDRAVWFEKSAKNAGKSIKNGFFLHFLAKIFGHFKKKQYLCTRFRKKGGSTDMFAERFRCPEVVSRSRAVVARQAHNLKVVGSIPSSATRESLRRLFFFASTQEKMTI